ncbi:hypothetical protein P3W70_07070 [Achromobacter denitrificans]|uniref:hypothetical protein n=1 Tax=Achromobacter denitrificans TaxID=32002 RepID=UPI0023E8CC68|nr:hypothetical protein [Achromobacter denitrificans]MDF3858100.1 hypothetical protein [Achromobacter denitrificans]
MSQFENLAGQRFGILTAVQRVDGKWQCTCDCGSVRLVLANNLKKGNSKSCGCVGRAKCARRMASLNRVHGDAGSKEHQIWAGIIKRCTRPSDMHWPKYGAQGITVAPEWMSYEQFLADMGRAPTPAHTIDRIDNNAGYSADNCRWATPFQQAQNRSTNRYTVVDGKVVCFSEAARLLGIERSRIFSMARRGLVEEVPYIPGGGATLSREEAA